VFLAKLWPVFKKVLKGEPVFTSMSWEQVNRTF
jgi:transformation/transcription domain-associated protein